MLRATMSFTLHFSPVFSTLQRGQLFKISQIDFYQSIPMYRLKTIDKEAIVKGQYYKEDLRRAKPLKKLKSIVGQRKKNNRAEVKIKTKRGQTKWVLLNQVFQE